MKALHRILFVLVAGLMGCLAFGQTVVGSKAFTESYILGEAAKTLLQNSGQKDVTHKVGMGKTIILWEALQSNSIQVYPEYTGTIAKEILKLPGTWDAAALADGLKRNHVGMTAPLGFNNTYALVMRRSRAQALGISKISDLRQHPELPCGPTLEFLGRNDGWKPMSAKYGLAMSDVKGIEHALGYKALMSGSIDVKDAYSTDAAIADNDLIVLKDDLNFFPAYQAVYLYRLELPAPAVTALGSLAGKIDETAMTKANAEAEKSKDYAAAAGHLLTAVGASSGTGSTGGASGVSSIWSDLGKATVEHIKLVAISMFFAILVGVPLGIAAARPGLVGSAILSVSGLIQTIPSLALFAVLVPWLGTEPRTAILALFLYSLLPIVRNTAIGLSTISPGLRESAVALGLEPTAQLWKIELPLAGPTILAGIKTSAIINVGTAAIAAFIGAGGLGQPIQTGLSLSDNSLILRGSIAAALLALGVQLGFDLLERILVPKGLRLSSRA